MSKFAIGSAFAFVMLYGNFSSAQDTANAVIYKVGPKEIYTSLTAAVAAATAKGGPADIQVDPGTYTDDFPNGGSVNTPIQGIITIEGIGGLAKFVATQPPPNQKGILDVAGNITLRYLDLSGAAVSADQGGNGAGVRYESGTLLIQNCFIHGNQDGLLANGDPNGAIAIDHSEFASNGNSDGYAHNIYIGAGGVGGFTLTNSYIHDAIVGHEVKSRALVTDIENNRIYDNNGSSSYSIDTPNGGSVTVKNNVIEQGPNSQNPAIIAIGEEGNLHPNSSLMLTGNTIVNDLTAHAPAGILNPNSVPVTADSNSLYGISSDAFDSSATNTKILSSRPNLDTSSPIQPIGTPGTGISTTAWYNVANANSGLCLDDSGWGQENGTPIIQWKCGSQQANQEWQFQSSDSGYYRVVNRYAPWAVLDVEYEGTTNAYHVHLWQNYDLANQQWMPVPLGKGLYKFVGRGSGRCLDVPYATANPGTQLWIWDCNGTGAQAFSLAVQQ